MTERLKAGSERGAEADDVMSSIVMVGKPEAGLGTEETVPVERSIEKEWALRLNRTTAEARRGGRGSPDDQERTEGLSGGSREREWKMREEWEEEKSGWERRMERAAVISEMVRGSRG